MHKNNRILIKYRKYNQLSLIQLMVTFCFCFTFIRFAHIKSHQLASFYNKYFFLWFYTTNWMNEKIYIPTWYIQWTKFVRILFKKICSSFSFLFFFFFWSWDFWFTSLMQIIFSTYDTTQWDKLLKIYFYLFFLWQICSSISLRIQCGD